MHGLGNYKCLALLNIPKQHFCTAVSVLFDSRQSLSEALCAGVARSPFFFFAAKPTYHATAAGATRNRHAGDVRFHRDKNWRRGGPSKVQKTRTSGAHRITALTQVTTYPTPSLPLYITLPRHRTNVASVNMHQEVYVYALPPASTYVNT